MGEFAGSTTAHQRGPTCCTSWLPVCSSSRAPAAVQMQSASSSNTALRATTECPAAEPRGLMGRAASADVLWGRFRREAQRHKFCR